MENQLSELLLGLLNGDKSVEQVAVGRYRIRIKRDGIHFLCSFYYDGYGIGAWASYEGAIAICHGRFRDTVVEAVKGTGYHLNYII